MDLSSKGAGTGRDHGSVFDPWPWCSSANTSIRGDRQNVQITRLIRGIDVLPQVTAQTGKWFDVEPQLQTVWDHRERD
jgi:hypothetical protein